jgi:hypothetical protein
MNKKIREARRNSRPCFTPPAGLCLLLLGTAVLLFSCEEPVPLHGSWADNMGNSMTFLSDDTFSGSVTSNGVQTSYQGTYSVLLNAITFQCSEPAPLRIVSEWDIRGNKLYLDWTNEYGPFRLTLYKVSN